MLQAHSLLWHYLWVAPNVLLLCLGLLVWKRRSANNFPAFLAFCFLASSSELGLYFADILPSVSGPTFWRIDWACLVIEGCVKFLLIGGIFTNVFGAYVSLARFGGVLIRGVGVALVMAAALAAAFAPKNGSVGIIAGAHLLDQTIYLIESGLLLFIFAFASHFRLSFNRQVFGIALGLAISSCVHLATWAVMANGTVADSARYDLDFLNMAIYHFCVFIWFYYLLVPSKVVTKSVVPLPENNLAVWNRELERLLQQ